MTNLVDFIDGEEQPTNTKVCSECGELKHHLDFGGRGHKKDGTYERKNQCKTCLRKRNRDTAKHKKIYPKPDIDYCCPICKLNEKQIKDKWKGFQGHSYMTKNIWRYDHHHLTRKFRDIICDYCNVMIGRSGDGKTEDSPNILESGAAYLRKHNV